MDLDELYERYTTDEKIEKAMRDKRSVPSRVSSKKRPRTRASARVSIEDEIDLHGYTTEDAEARTRVFIDAAFAHRKSRVLIITGKGTGVLQRHIAALLEEMVRTGQIRAFECAPQSKGGSGAFVVAMQF